MKKISIVSIFCVSFILLAMGADTATAKIIYVNAARPAGGDGSSWSSAFKYLQDGLAAATSGDQIWVVEGTYRPDEGTGRILNSPTETFNLKNGVALYGGFAGNETIRDQRNRQSRKTILTGNIGTVNNPTDNSYHVVTANGVDSSAILDGFTITKGYADGTYPDNAGGGMYIYYSDGPTVVNCIFEDNYAYYGGGVYAYMAKNLVLTNCSFVNNGSNDGFYVVGGLNTRSVNTLFYESSVRVVNGWEATFVNCTFFDNSWVIRVENSWSGNGLVLKLYNSIVWGNTTTNRIYATVDPSVQLTSAIFLDIAYNVIKNGIETFDRSAKVYFDPPYAENHNKDTDPLLIAPGATPPNLRLAPTSPAIDAGNNTMVPEDTTDLDGDGNTAETIPLDPDGHLRCMDESTVVDTGAGTPPIVDIGAYEHNRVIHVDASAHGSNDGTSWGNAFVYLQDGLSKAVSTTWDDEIWVAGGTYYPDQGGTPPANPREATFQLRSGVSLYGGFAGTETRRVERNWRAYRTVLSGDRGTPGDISDNSYHVVTASGTNATAVLNGFTITEGIANGTYPHNEGGGLYNNGGRPVVANCIFLNNSAGDGGGVYNNSTTLPRYINCAFLGNWAVNGGGMYNYRSKEVEVTNSIFSGNEAQYGGGLEDWESLATTITNCTFSHNTAYNYGGGINTLYGGDYTTLRNTILWDNTAPNGAQIAVASSMLSYRFCDLQGGDSGVLVEGSSVIDKANNLMEDPHFLDADGGDNLFGTGDDNVRLGDTGCIDAGAAKVPPDVADLDEDGDTSEAIPVDLDGRPRAIGTMDMGAYERGNLILYVNYAATGRNDGLRWAHAFNTLQDALFKAFPGDEIWVAQGRYTPDRGGGKRLGDRKASFFLKSGVGLYGGFTGTETSRSQRNWKTNLTILNGDLGRNDGWNFTNYEDNSHHVVVGSGTDATAVIDGFTISGGHANHPDFAYPENGGAGMYNQGGSPTISNCIFEKNYAELRGGAAILNHGSSSPTITRCIFRDNSAGTSGTGGALYNAYGSSPRVTNCMFRNNSASYGGAMHNVYTSVVNVTNCTFGYNHAYTRGGAIRSFWFSHVTMKNSILWGNTSAQGPQIALDEGSMLTMNYSDLQGGQTYVYPPGATVNWGPGNMDKDPLFADAALHLDLLSPCVDAGDPASPYSNEPLPNGDRIDMGAYGNTEEATITVPIMGDLNGDRELDISDVILDLRMALELEPPRACSDLNGDGKVDISDVILTLRMALGLDPKVPC